MKKYILIVIGLLALTSCKKYLDVKPQSQIDESQLFSSAQGFKEALNGVYTLCSSTDLYGGNLTFGSYNGLVATGGLDVLAQNYQFSDAISSDIENFDYTQPYFVATTTDIWNTAYRAITNCNYILAAIDGKKNLFTGRDYELIKGEALTLRAYIHFDLLRMFAPSYASNPAAKGIPYVTVVGTKSTAFSTVTQALDACIKDLNAAKVLLNSSDPILAGYTVGYPGQTGQNEDANTDLFYQNRRHRMNFYTVCGELARVYLYKNDYANALANAQIIIKSKIFPWTNQADFFSKDITQRDRIFYKELISCWFVDNSDINKEVQNLFTASPPVLSATTDQVAEIYESAQSGADDWRYKQWFIAAASSSGATATERAILQKYVENTTPVTNLYPLVAPAMRLSEMYYIAAESSYNSGDTQSALSYFNTVRKNRGIGDSVTTVADKATFNNLLLTEARKEFYGESQIFYMYKRLNHGIPITSTYMQPASDKIFVFPLPIDEEAYRNN
ncbi:MAG TPA: RagB/SusD family nutrient uptake outer membrane protein [Mucilaginibacter sp.]|nr:RagB/SusD family nutrient uptake outer membrane protein [Mucilaginibacter sp.]